jgi:nitrate/TMAO reductase-like tetraheme cytochrome c subunit
MGALAGMTLRRLWWGGFVAFAFCGVLAASAQASISGRVLDDGTDAPVVGAVVRVQATDGPTTVTDASGQFTLAVAPTTSVNIGAALPYRHDQALNYLSNAAFAVNGQTDVEVRLPRLPVAQNSNYAPLNASVCGSCHDTHHEEWTTARHASAARNSWVLDLYAGTGTPGGSAGYIFKNLHDPGESGFCASCHAPMQDVFTPGQLAYDQISTQPGRDGVSCLGCHQQAQVNPAFINGIAHVDGKVSYRFPDDPTYVTSLYVFGNLPDVENTTMRNSYSPLFGTSLICAGCHQYNRPDNGAPGQNTYNEWLASPYAQPGPGLRTCQNCHMPNASGPGPIAATAGFDRPASQRHRHDFVGSTPTTLTAAILLNATASENAGQLLVNAQVENRGAGHSFPTGISIRNAILVLDVRANGQPLAQTGGPVVPFYGSDDVAGVQPGDLAGLPGKGFAKILQGRINDQGPVLRPVLFIDAESTLENTVIPSGTTDNSVYSFQLPPDIAVGTPITVEARLLYRRAFRALAVTKGWTETPSGGPIEIEVARQSLSLAAAGSAPASVPGPGTLPLVLLALGLFGLGAVLVRRR